MKQLLSILMCLNLILLPISLGHAKEEKKDSKGGSSMNQILALGTGIIGSNILMSCKLGGSTPSIIAFFGGSVVYIGSEILGAKAQQAFIKVKKDEIAQLKASMTEGGDLQKGIIEAKLKEEEDKLGFVQKRKMWMTAVATIYTTATALAVVEMICTKSVVASATCTNWFMAGCEGGSSLPSSKLLSYAVLGAYGFGTSSAGGGAISTYGTLLYAGLTYFVPSLSTTISAAYQTPETRIATFGAGTALTMIVLKELMGIEKDLQGNIKDLKTLLADFNNKTKDPNGVTDGAGPIDLAKDNINLSQGSGNLGRLTGTDLTKHCFGKDASGNQTYSDTVCNKTVKIPKPQYNSKLNLPTLQSVANTGNDMAQAVASGNIGAADIAAANLASNAMRVKEIQDNLLKQLNNDLKKQGKKPLDFNKEVDRTIASMRKNLERGMSSQGSGLASLPANANSKGDGNSQDALTQDVKTAGSGEAINIGDSGINFKEEFSEENGAGSTTEEFPVAHSLEDFETQESDILNEPSVSIFEQLSNRYFLNYNKIFSKPKLDDTNSITK